MNLKKNIWLYLALFMTLIIWINSMLSAEMSSQQSGFLVNLALSVLSLFKIVIPIDAVSSFIRTYAHFAEFFMLAICWGFYLLKKSFSSLWVFVIIIVTAFMDESIQLFSLGRAFQFFDIMIDSIGGLFGFIFIQGFTKIKNK